MKLAVTQLVDVEWAFVESDSHHHHGFWLGGPEPLDRDLWLFWLQTGAERLKAVVDRHHGDILVFGCHTESVYESVFDGGLKDWFDEIGIDLCCFVADFRVSLIRQKACDLPFVGGITNKLTVFDGK